MRHPGKLERRSFIKKAGSVTLSGMLALKAQQSRAAEDDGGMETIPLNGEWEISSADEEYGGACDVPGTIFSSLEPQGEFGKEGIFYRENNRLCLKRADRDFVFRRTFAVLPSCYTAIHRNSSIVLLEAGGLDTLADIYINGQRVGQTENMHRRYAFDIKKFLKPGENQIEIVFSNTLEFLRCEQPKRNLWHSYWDEPGIAVKGFNTIRKSHCSYGWDWGPIVPDIGIWRKIQISIYKGAKINGVQVIQQHMAGKVVLQILPDVKIWNEADYQLEAIVTDPDGKSESHPLAINSPTLIRIDNAQLWWPNGLGKQPLYSLQLILRNGNRIIHNQLLKVGLRTLTVRREKDQWGEAFAFEVNGIPIFSRGADYIPEDIILTRVTRQKTERLIKDCVAANFNTIRVWGGGVYPSDDFYDLCDQYGLIIWQDLMFACALYDINNKRFFDNIKEEVRDNLLRIRHHASIGLICGNNEMEWGFVEWGFPQTSENKTEYLMQYQFAFPEIMKELCPQIFYWPASPSSGGNFEEPNSPDRGDCHYWDVWHGNKDYSEFEKHYFRFMSEFGFESLPSMKTIRSFCTEEDLNIFSPVMEDHQRCSGGGNQKILDHIARYFRYPKDLSHLAYTSQISQAEALRHGIEHWRRNRGRCMGSIYWQLNDNWPVASWSSIDYFGRWKALHYLAKRAYDNVLVSCAKDGSRVSVHLSNERKEPVSGTVDWKLIDVAGKTITYGKKPMAAPALSSTSDLTIDLAEHLKDKMPRDRFFICRFTDSEGKTYYSFCLFDLYKSLSLKKPAYACEARETADNFEISVSANCPALFVELDLAQHDAVFSDNYFYLDGQEKRVITTPKNNLTLKILNDELRVRSLVDAHA
jgi:beta-mannosidase